MLMTLSDGKSHDVNLEDDGTMDTVVSVDGHCGRFDGEYSAQYRHETGAMSEWGLKTLANEVLEDMESLGEVH